MIFTRILKKISIISIIAIQILSAQDATNWDNQLYLGNKVAGGKNDWKFSGELQTRLENNFQELDNWYFEFVANYLANKNIELVPDFRFTIKPDRLEYRPGFGFLYKHLGENIQFVNQIKWQIDIDNHGKIGNAGREVVFLNYK